MQRLEYRSDKTSWPDGAWKNEPDKVQWEDEQTKLPCLIVRGPSGGLCGYVGVPQGHRLYQIEYSHCPEKCGKDWCDHRPERRLDVHGGITFSGACAQSTPEVYQRYLDAVPKHRETARTFPQGDSATWLKAWEPVLRSYEAWLERRHATAICHVPGPGDSDSIWWFGFDCAHAGDLCPSMKLYTGPIEGETYRDIAYVTHECEELAKQLVAL